MVVVLHYNLIHQLHLASPEDIINNCSKYSSPKSSNTTTFSTLTPSLSSFSSFFVFFAAIFRPKECLLFKATTGEHPSSCESEQSISLSDSFTFSTGKLSTAAEPRMAKAAWSYASAAASALSNVPSHTLMPCRVESLISAANFPHGRLRTPRKLLLGLLLLLLLCCELSSSSLMMSLQEFVLS